jgi:hypothetical protein
MYRMVGVIALVYYAAQFYKLIVISKGTIITATMKGRKQARNPSVHHCLVARNAEYKPFDVLTRMNLSQVWNV